MKIGIVETEHFEVAYAFIRLFQQPGNSIVVFTNSHVRKQLEQQLATTEFKLEWIEQSAEQSRFQFIRYIFRRTNSDELDQLHLSTISNYHLVYAFFLKTLRKTQVILTVHDINSLFKSKPAFNLRSLVQHLGKKTLVEGLRFFNVISETLIEELKQNIDRRATIINLPGGIFEGFQSKQDPSHELRLVVPGSVDNSRRNYHEVLRLVEKVEDLGKRVRITLLGRPVGKGGSQIIEALKSFESTSVSVKTYNSFVEPGEYAAKLKECHFVYLPSTIIYHSSDGVIEQYGTTKSSGGIFDAIVYAKPLIVPSGLSLPAHIQSSSIRYNSINDIMLYLRQVISSPDEYERLQREAATNSQHYSVEAVRKRNAWLFAGNSTSTPKT